MEQSKNIKRGVFMASTHKKIALSVAASQELERLEKKKAKINKKIKELKGVKK